MKKLTVYGLPLTPERLLEELDGASFCVSYGTSKRLGKQLDQAIRLVGDDGILLVDNGAFSNHRAGRSSLDEAYLAGFEQWAAAILARCPQAVAVIPDMIGGTEQQNRELAASCRLRSDRLMFVWHMDESLEQLLWACESFSWIAFGSSGKFWQTGTAAWHERVAAAFAAIEAWERDSDGAFIRPRIHMMRAQAQAHLYPFDSSDSTNVALNHCRYKAQGTGHVARFAARLDARIQATAGAIAEHQVKRPIAGDELEDFAAAFFRSIHEEIDPTPPAAWSIDLAEAA